MSVSYNDKTFLSVSLLRISRMSASENIKDPRSAFFFSAHAVLTLSYQICVIFFIERRFFKTVLSKCKQKELDSLVPPPPPLAHGVSAGLRQPD